MFQREFGLVHNPGSPAAFMRLVRWERRWTRYYDTETSPSEEWEELHLVPTVWVWDKLDISNPRALTYDGPEWRWVPVSVTEVAQLKSTNGWPKDVSTETEEMRRLRIRTIRQAIHVDPEKGNFNPWSDEEDQQLAAA